MKIFKEKNLREAIGRLKSGKILICPTDTVYGLICDATNEKAIKRLFVIKKRKRNKSIPIFVKDLKMAEKVAFINEKQEKIIKKHWPGKTTFVLRRKKLRIYGVDKKTIALRIPNNKVIRYLLSSINCPLTGTSANISGQPASTKIKEVISQFENQKFKPDAIINAGDLKPSRPSKIIDLTGDKIKVLRK